MSYDHGAPPQATPPAAPLFPADDVRRRTPAEEARTLVAGTIQATLATLSDDGGPWASLVTFGALGDGAPVLCVSTLAEHGRNLQRDQRASLMVAQEGRVDDPLAQGRVTLAGRAEAVTDPGARAAYVEAIGPSSFFVDFSDFTLWVLRVERVRWVGGYGRMASAEAADYAVAAPDPVGPAAGGAVVHLNEDHADALLLMARALAGHPDATSATCLAADRYGLDLMVEGPRGKAWPRVGFATPVADAGGLRAATVELTRWARAQGT